MKRNWTLLLILMLATVPVLAASITVSSPAAGATLEIGKSLPIAWTFTGLSNSAKVTISLWQGAAKLGNIVEDLAIGSAGQGTYAWTAGTHAGGTATAGGDYFVKLRTGEGSLTAKSGTFTLAAQPGNSGGTKIFPQPIKGIPQFGTADHPCLAVTAPKKNDICDPVNSIYIKWIHAAGQDANVSITLLRQGKGTMLLHGLTVAASAPNNGAFTWNPPSPTLAPGLCKLRIKTLDGKCEALSEEFMIAEVGGIELLSPLGGEVWENGTSHAVNWKRLGNIRYVDILLTRSNSVYRTLAQGVDAKLGTKTCIFERSPYDEGNPCHYVLFLKHSAGGTSAASGCITLTGNPDLAVTHVAFSGLFNVGYDQSFTIKVENKGAVASQACLGELKVNGVTAKTFPVPAILPGQSVNLSVTWKVACPGALKISIDAGGANIEADKTNNVWEKNIC